MTEPNTNEPNREFELTQYVSLLKINPTALVQLRQQGKCNFELQEELFDRYFPGHYMRRINSVILIIRLEHPGTFTMNLSLRLVKNSVRFNSSSEKNYPRESLDGIFLADPTRFMDDHQERRAIFMISSDQQEDMAAYIPKDNEKPFYRAGVISTWDIEVIRPIIPNGDKLSRVPEPLFPVIVDLILKINFTSRIDFNLEKAARMNQFLSPKNPSS